MWSIALLENTIRITEECAKDLFKNAQEYEDEIWWSVEDVAYHAVDEDGHAGQLCFNPDHHEHMDYLWNEKVQEILKEHKVEGRVCFADVEGDSFGSFWGYQFDGQGNLENLKGKVVWSVDYEDAA